MHHSGDSLDMPGEQPLLDHIKHEQRLHAVKRNAFPKFGSGQYEQALWMTEEVRLGEPSCCERVRTRGF